MITRKFEVVIELPEELNGMELDSVIIGKKIEEINEDFTRISVKEVDIIGMYETRVSK